MDRRTILKGAAAVVAGATTIPNTKAASVTEGRSLTSLVADRRTAQAKNNNADTLFSQAAQKFRDAIPTPPPETWVTWGKYEEMTSDFRDTFMNPDTGKKGEFILSTGWMELYRNSPDEVLISTHIDPKTKRLKRKTKKVKRKEYLENYKVALAFESEWEKLPEHKEFGEAVSAQSAAKEELSEINRAIYSAPITCLADIQAKLEFLCDCRSDDPDAWYCDIKHLSRQLSRQVAAFQSGESSS